MFGKNKKTIKLINLTELMLINKWEVNCLSKKVAEKNILYLSIKTVKNRKSKTNRADKKITVFKKK